MLGQGYQGVKPPLTEKLGFFGLSDLPVIGPILFGHDWIVYFSILLVAATWAFLKYTRAG